MTKKEIVVDGETYVNKSEAINTEYAGELRIVILQRGWIMVGKFERKDSECKLHNAYVIRYWGTSKGLGEIAENGPLSDTKLDKCYGVVEFDYLTVVATISVNKAKWQAVL